MSLRLATELGYTVLTDPAHPIADDAARLLPLHHPALGIAVTDSVIHVVFDHIPTGAEILALERATGRQVAVSVCTPTTLAALKARCAAPRDGAADILNLLAALPPTFTSITLIPGRAPHYKKPERVTPGNAVHPASAQPLLSAESIEAFVAWAGVSEHAPAVCALAGSTWRVSVHRAGGTQLVDLHRVAPHDTPNTRPLARALADLDTVDRGLVLIATPHGHGRTTLLNELSLRASARLSTGHDIEDLAHIHLDAPPLTHSQPGTTHYSLGVDHASVAAAVQSAMRRRTRIVTVDVDRYSSSDLQETLAAALSGALVFISIPAHDLSSALTALLLDVDDSKRQSIRAGLAACFQAGVAQQLHSGATGRIPVLETWWRNPALTAALADVPLTALRAVDRSSSTTSARGTTMEGALADARAAGLIA